MIGLEYENEKVIDEKGLRKMSQVCKCCAHENRDILDAALIQGIPKRRISTQFGMSEGSVRRHAKNHLMSTLAASSKAYEMTQGEILLHKIEALEYDAQFIKRELLDKEDHIGALRAIRELVRILELLARLKGELIEIQQVNIFLSPEWTQVQTLILKTMEPYPEAREKLLTSLEEYNEHR